jgi:hypothetical protein
MVRIPVYWPLEFNEQRQNKLVLNEGLEKEGGDEGEEGVLGATGVAMLGSVEIVLVLICGISDDDKDDEDPMISFQSESLKAEGEAEEEGDDERYFSRS